MDIQPPSKKVQESVNKKIAEVEHKSLNLNPETVRSDAVQPEGLQPEVLDTTGMRRRSS